MREYDGPAPATLTEMLAAAVSRSPAGTAFVDEHRSVDWGTLATEVEALAGFLALQDSYIDRLYIHPAHQRRGVGSALMEQAKALSPAGLELHTHQKNTQARAFYERHGFTIAKLGISPPPESEPDIEYHWRPPHA